MWVIAQIFFVAFFFFYTKVLIFKHYCRYTTAICKILFHTAHSGFFDTSHRWLGWQLLGRHNPTYLLQKWMQWPVVPIYNRNHPKRKIQARSILVSIFFVFIILCKIKCFIVKNKYNKSFFALKYAYLSNVCLLRS